MAVNGQQVDLEVQVSNEGDYPERVMYHWAREFSSANMISFGLFDESENDLFRKSIIFYNTISQETVNKFFDTSAIDGLKFPK